MANTKSARKRVRNNEFARARNRSMRSRLRTHVKKFRVAVKAEDTAKVSELLTPTLSLVDHSWSTGLLHRNTASRLKSRLTKAAQTLQTQEG